MHMPSIFSLIDSTTHSNFDPEKLLQQVARSYQLFSFMLRCPPNCRKNACGCIVNKSTFSVTLAEEVLSSSVVLRDSYTGELVSIVRGVTLLMQLWSASNTASDVIAP